MRIDVLTIFPEMFHGITSESIIKNAITNGFVEINIIDFRDFSINKHNKVDDYPYGGGQGMVIGVQPVIDALKSIPNYESAKKYIMTPQGAVWNQTLAYQMSEDAHIILFAGHYEGYDERIRDYFDGELSIGDFVLTGGEIPALVIMDSVIRLLPGVIKEESHLEDSHSTGLLEGPQYTRPEEYDGKRVPDVLLSGHHKNIEAYRKEQSIEKTKAVRPDLFTEYQKKNK